MRSSADGEPVRLKQTFRSLFYTPLYVSISGGFFQQEGLNIEFSTCPTGYNGLNAVASGIADIAQSGPMRSIIAADWGAEVVPAHIIEINSRDGFFIVGRAPQARFDWADLKGATLITAGFSPMPPASLAYVLKRKGIVLDEIRQIKGLSLQEQMDAFRRGEGDFVQLPQPLAEQLQWEGTGHTVAAVGPEIGHIAFSTFVTTHRYLDAQPEVLLRFTRGFYNAQKWLADNDAGAVAELVTPFFQDVESRVVLGSVERYKAQDTWAKDPLLREDGYNTLQDVLEESGLIRRRHPYERIVYPGFARQVIGE